MANPDVNVKITADASGVVKGVAVAQGALGKLSAQMGQLEAVSAKGFSLLGFAGIAGAAAAAGAALIGAVRSAADYGDQLDNMSQRTGVAVEDLSRLGYAAKLSDTSTEALGKGLKFLSGIMVAAAGGAEESSKLFEKYGIAVRNTDGSVRDTSEVLMDLADVFAALPDGAQKSALATEFFGKKMGTELIPLLNQGRAAIKAMGDEAERLGLVLNSNQAKAAADFNDNLDRMAALSKASAVAIGNALLPAINEFLQKLMLARDNKLSIGQILFDVLPKQSGDIDQQIAKVVAGLEKIKAARDAAMKSNREDGGGTDTSGLESDIAKQEKMLAYLQAQRKKAALDEEAENNKRVLAAATLSGKLQQLEKLRAIAAGEASIDILKSDKELNAARLKDAQALADAIKAAYASTVADAKTASEAAIALFDKARDKRTGAADKAFDKSTQGMSEEDKAAVNAAQAQDLFDQGRYAVAAAGAAKLDGRLEQMASYQKQAEEYLKRAESFADKSGNADLITGIAEAQAQMLEQQAKAKQQEAADLQQKSADQMATLNAIEAKIREMTQTAANFEIRADMTQLESDIARIRGEIAKGATMPINAAMQGGGGQINPDAGASGSFEGGGFTGWMGRKSIAGVVHGQEYVTPAGVTSQPGVLSFLEALRRQGNKVLPGYERGGLVTDIPAGPSIMGARPSGTPLVLDFGKLGRYQAQADTDTAKEMERVLKRAVLGFGRA